MALTIRGTFCPLSISCIKGFRLTVCGGFIRTGVPGFHLFGMTVLL